MAKKIEERIEALEKLAEHTLHITSNCIKLCHSMDLYVEELFRKEEIEHG